jgi:CheY-like chemotaxis protein
MTSQVGETVRRKVLIVEDEYFIAMEMANAFRQAGLEVVGPVATVAKALQLIEASGGLDGAVLDINLQSETAYPVAEALLDRDVPIVLTTGYDAQAIDPRFVEVPRCEKPVEPERILRKLFP